MPDLFVGSPATTSTASPSLPLVTAGGHSLPLLATLRRDMVGIDGVTFANQDTDERVILFLRRSLITNVPWIVVTILALFFPITFPFILSQVAPTFVLPTSYAMVLLGFYYLLVIGFALYQIISWFYNISIVSNKKIVDVNYSRITAKDIETATIDAAADVTYVQNGFIKTLFNFGNVVITTESATARIIFELVPKPSDIVATIIDLKQGVTEP